jgi:hypothetical protein
VLTAIVNAPEEPEWKKVRAAVLLHLAERLPGRGPGVSAYSQAEIAGRCGCSPALVHIARRRYAVGGIEWVMKNGRGLKNRKAPAAPPPVYANITLKNGGDVTAARRGYIGADKVRELSVRAMVDTGTLTLVISEQVRLKLGLDLRGQQTVRSNPVPVTEPVEVSWKDRSMSCQALVTEDAGWEDEDDDGEGAVLLGVLPLEGMDLMVNPVNRELADAHGVAR